MRVSDDEWTRGVVMAGQPTKYKKEYDEQARKLCLMGYTDAQLADFFNVTETTINNWKNQHKSFFESLKAGKVIADAEVVDSLYHRAKGCSHTETKVVSTQNGVELVDVEKHYPPDPTSMIFWLKNRQPDKWRDKQPEENEDKPSSPVTIQFNNVTKDAD
jgi:DNA-binding XRE family transcriptional regulator